MKRCQGQPPSLGFTVPSRHCQSHHPLQDKQLTRFTLPTSQALRTSPVPAPEFTYVQNTICTPLLFPLPDRSYWLGENRTVFEIV